MGEWIQIRSWHAIRTPTRMPRRYITVCGKDTFGDAVTDLPPDSKLCKRCVAITTRLNAGT